MLSVLFSELKGDYLQYSPNYLTFSGNILNLWIIRGVSSAGDGICAQGKGLIMENWPDCPKAAGSALLWSLGAPWY